MFPERREIPFIRLHFTDHMNVKWKTCWKSSSRKIKTYNVDVVVVITIIIAMKREICVFLLCGRLWYVSVYYLWTAFCSLPVSHESWNETVLRVPKWTKVFFKQSCRSLASISQTSYHRFFQLKSTHTKLEPQNFSSTNLFKYELMLSGLGLTRFEYWLWLIGIRWQSCLYHMTLAVAT